jgi:hypothetical protein
MLTRVSDDDRRLVFRLITSFVDGEIEGTDLADNAADVEEIKVHCEVSLMGDFGLKFA